ncbi:receptor-like protein kinase THESEUS 1 [Senna tora]|uniref:Receptor-like protein kinase THESEUS 1 n=1 Tax=Senna tora TaxID=362788 RepID=A0A835C384_9FABA|nr:receptor-like protein kinase THESEUS 1 [Senna tora]
MNPDKCFPSPLFLAVIIIIVVVVIVIIIIIILFVNYYSCAATTTTFTPIDNYLIACGSSQNITFAGRTFIADSQHSTKKSIIVFNHNINTSSTRQEPVENPKQSGARDFPHLPPNQGLPLSRRRTLLLLHSPEALLRFLRQDQIQRDDGAERYVQWPWILLRWWEFWPPMRVFERVEQDISLTYLQTKHFFFHGGGGFFSFTLTKHFCIFSGKICCNETTAPRYLSGGHGSSFDGESFCRR